MKPKLKPLLLPQSSCTLGAAVALSLALNPSHLQAEATFNNFNGVTADNTLDGGGIGGFMKVNDASVAIDVTLETVEIQGQNGLLTSSGEAGSDNKTFSNSSDDLGVQSELNVGNYGNDGRDFNPGESWTFKFDVDVTLDAIRFAGWGEGSEMTLSSSVFANDQVMTVMPYDLGKTLLPAGTEVKIAMTAVDNGTNDVEVRLDYLTVSAVPAPPTGANLKWTGTGGNAWNTSLTNWADTDNGDAPIAFKTGDNVTIDQAAAIAVDGAGITSGFVTVSAADSVSFSGGDLTTETFTKSGAGTLAINNQVEVAASLVAISEGIIQIEDGGGFTTSGLSLSGGAGSELVINDTTSGAFTNTGATSLEDTGGTFRVNTDAFLTLGEVTSSGAGARFAKAGEGEMAVTGVVATDPAPVDLQVEEGTLHFEGSVEVQLSNPSGTNVLNGLMTLTGSQFNLHGVNFQGTGSIESLESTSRLRGDFNSGHNTVNVPVVLSADLTAEARPDNTNGSSVTFEQVISGPGNLIKEGPGNVFLEADNTYLGTTTVSEGILRVGGGTESTSGTLGGGDVTVALGATLQFSRSDALVVPNLILGEGAVALNGAATSSVALDGANEYTGPTTITGGTLQASVIGDVGSASSMGFGTIEADSLQFRGGGLSYIGADDAQTDRNFFLGGGGGVLSADGEGSLAFYASAVIGQGTGVTARTLTLGGSVSKINEMGLDLTDGPVNEDGAYSVVSLTKTGTTTWELTGDNSYTGATTVEEGTLSLLIDYLADTSSVSIGTASTTGVLDLPHGSGDVVDTLFIDGVQVAAGTYGSSSVTGTTLDNVDDAHFSGDGWLVVTSGPSGEDYGTWAASFGLVGGPTDDDDNDGVSNEDEYAFGLNPTSGSSVSPYVTQLDQGTGIFSYTRRTQSLTGLTYSYSYSTDLSEWTSFTPAAPTPTTDGGDPVEVMTIAVPAELLGNDKLFIQVSAD
ncbi:autotransporter-associated beta strand repeat-containing protein [Haloferula chungangensis]|uniref:Autotransporter-associated beta strand repeat-containing protein n=1 Tax=Haloferula chungangensis TaxID=1048331 RepID=A0ABW2L907_9BACT